jgi:hypothetical protein
MYEEFTVQYHMGSYPERPSKPIKPANMLDVNELKAYTEKVEKYNIEIAKYNDIISKRREKENELDKKFKQHLAEDNKKYYGFSDEICDMIYNKAYDDGHASGLHEIANIYVELSDFVKNILNLSKK